MSVVLTRSGSDQSLSDRTGDTSLEEDELVLWEQRALLRLF